MLPAGGTIDATAVMPTSAITLSLFDRQPGFYNESELASNATETGPGSSLGAITVGEVSTITTAAKIVNDDEFTINEDTATPTNGNVLSNDDVPPNACAQIVTQPAHGQLSSPPGQPGCEITGNFFNNVGVFSYQPDPNFSGLDQFNYEVTDGAVSYGVGHVTLNVTYVNDTPTAQGDSYVNTKGAVITVAPLGVLANDIDVDGDQLRVEIVGQVPPNLELTTMMQASAFDSDGDGVDDLADNCTTIANPLQLDSDGDGHGNICDADLDNDNLVSFSDFSIFRAVFGSADPDADFDGDGVVSFSDFSIIRSSFGSPPGPSCVDAANGCAALYDGGFTYSGTTDATFSYKACDPGGACSNTVDVTLTTKELSDITLTVNNEIGTPISDYKWTVEEDATWHPDPTQPPSYDVLAMNFHKSYMPVVAQGTGAAEFAQLALDDNKHYYVTVLPADGASESGHTTGAAQFKGSDTEVAVKVHTTPTEMAQISILIFNDNAPTNAVWSGGEEGLGGFTITLEDGGGRYGASAGILSYDAFGEPLTNALDCFGTDGNSLGGVIMSCPDTPENRAAGLVGQVLIKNLYPGKYGVITTPPADQVTDWVQTSTIEGTKVIDAWVKAGEPAYFQEFGPPGWHVFTGFVNPTAVNDSPLALQSKGTNVVSGQVTNAHMSRPPLQLISDSGTYDALSHTRPWLSVNSQGGNGPSVAVVQAETDGSFTLPGLADGSYQLAIWDSYLDQVIAYRSFTVPGTVSLGNIPVFNWFARMENTVFKDDGGTCGPGKAENGFFDEACGELAMPEQNVNLRWRDGTIYQAGPTDGEGYVPFDQTFPFFHWLVAEIDYARYKPTGVTVAADHGGDVQAADNPYQYILNPQQQNLDDAANVSTDPNVRTELGPVLTQGFQAFLGQTNVIQWGKTDWPEGENGGISGIVYYATTRAENDPRLGVAEVWEPGVAGATVRLHRKVTKPGVIATEGDLLVEGDYTIATALDMLDNGTYRVQFGVMDLDQFVVLAEDYNSITVNSAISRVRFSVPSNNAYIGAPIALRVLTTGTADASLPTITLNEFSLVLVNETTTDNFDASVPDGCPGADPMDAEILGEPAGITTKCYDGIRNFNQVRPGVFDGGYAFNEDAQGNPLKPGNYVVEVVVPEGYEIVKEEDVNVGFGESYARVSVPLLFPTGGELPVPDTATTFVSLQGDVGIAQPRCAGALREVPPTMSLFPSLEEPAPFAGAMRPLCDRKEVQLVDQSQAAADFWVKTDAPIAGHFTGMILDDTATEFNARSPAFGEKWAPPYVPVAIRNAQGVEIGRVVSDQYGRFNGLVPSTISANLASPSGISPTMLITCMNDPGPIPDPNGPGMIVDPNFNPAYSNFCYTFQYMPGATTYLDTPVLPVSAFASGYNPPDCALPANTPEISMVETDQGDGPLVRPSIIDPVNGNIIHTVTLHSVGEKPVPNPAYQGPLVPGIEPTILRDFGFGGIQGTVTLNDTPLNVVSWSDATIVVEAPADVVNNGQLLVTSADGVTTESGITLTVSNLNENRVRRVPGEYPTIQAAIDDARVNDIVMVSPGAYNERVIMWQPVQLQGSGSGATVLNGALLQTEGLIGWRAKMDCLFGIGAGCTQVVDALPNQPAGAAGFLSEEGPTVTVLGPFDDGVNPRPANRFLGRNARIDGFAITGNSTGGGIFVNGYAHNLDISNNDVYGNSGGLHGGIRVGRPYLELADPQTVVGADLYDFNRNVIIDHNIIRQNGSVGVAGPGGAGAGVAIAMGSDRYRIEDNYVCGNFSLGDGGGIGHFGLSNAGSIKRNTIVLNQSFDQAQNTSGGGIFVGGEPANGQALTYGAGTVTIDDNLISRNHAAAGHGGGIRLQNINGLDLVNANVPNNMYRVTMRNNIIANNVAGWSGGGVSLVDALDVRITNNTIAHNDSTATVGNLITVNDIDNISVAQPAGLVTELNSPALNAAIDAKGVDTVNQWNNVTGYRYSNPRVNNNIIWKNRSFYYQADAANGPRLMPELIPTVAGECAPGANFWDIGVLDTGNILTRVTRSVLTDATGYQARNNNSVGNDPVFLAESCNGARWGAGKLDVHPTVDEGGAAWIDVRFGPLDVSGDYHIGATSSAISLAVTGLNWDIDGDARPNGVDDSGADEYYAAP